MGGRGDSAVRRSFRCRLPMGIWLSAPALGDWITARLAAGGAASGPWLWTLGRLGARVPLYGSVHKVVASEKAVEWVDVLLREEISRDDGALFAAAQLVRLTGDRARDVEATARQRVRAALEKHGAPPTWLRLVSEAAPMEPTDRARALGDTLPLGLQLAG